MSKKIFIILFVIVLICVFLLSCAKNQSVPTTPLNNTPTIMATITPGIILSTLTNTPQIFVSHTPSATVTNPVQATATVTYTVTVTGTLQDTDTLTATPTGTGTVELSATETATESLTFTETVTVTQTVEPAATATATMTATTQRTRIKNIWNFDAAATSSGSMSCIYDTSSRLITMNIKNSSGAVTMYITNEYTGSNLTKRSTYTAPANLLMYSDLSYDGSGNNILTKNYFAPSTYMGHATNVFNGSSQMTETYNADAAGTTSTYMTYSYGAFGQVDMYTYTYPGMVKQSHSLNTYTGGRVTRQETFDGSEVRQSYSDYIYDGLNRVSQTRSYDGVGVLTSSATYEYETY